MANRKHAGLLIAFIASMWLGAPAHASFIGANITVSDLAEPSPFGFAFGTPIPPLVGLVSWSADVSGDLLDPTGDGISAAPDGGSIFEFLIGGSVVASDTSAPSLPTLRPVTAVSSTAAPAARLWV